MPKLAALTSVMFLLLGATGSNPGGTAPEPSIDQCSRALYTTLNPDGNAGAVSDTGVTDVIAPWVDANAVELLDTRGEWTRTSNLAVWTYSGGPATFYIRADVGVTDVTLPAGGYTVKVLTAFHDEGAVTTADERTRGTSFDSVLITEDTGAETTPIHHGSSPGYVTDVISMDADDSLGLIFNLATAGVQAFNVNGYDIEIVQVDPPCF